MKKIGVGARNVSTAYHEVKISSDSSKVITLTADALRVWPSTLQEPLLEIPEPFGRGTCFTPAGECVVCGQEGAVEIWSVGTQEPVGRLEPVTAPLVDAEASPCGKILACSCWKKGHSSIGTYVQKNDGISIWHMQSETLLGRLAATRKSRFSQTEELRTIMAYDMVFSPTGRQLYVLESECVSSWRISDLQCTRCWEHKERPLCFDLSPDGKLLAVGYKSGKVRVWQQSDASRPISTFKVGSGPVRRCRFSADGRYLCALSQMPTSEGGNIKMPEGEDILSIRQVNARFASLWSIQQGYQEEWRHINGVVWSGFVGAPPLLAILDGDGFIRIVDLLSRETIFRWITDDPVFTIIPAPNGRYFLAVTRLNNVLAVSLEGYELSPPIVTCRTLFDGELCQYASQPTVDCAWCGKRFVPASSLVETLRRLSERRRAAESSLVETLRRLLGRHRIAESPCANLPSDAWDDPALVSKCPHCKRPLKYNPFVVEDEE
jgi:WD40 repeat protein